MCVICVKRANQKMPTKEKVEAMWKKNPDGAGIMWRYNGKVGFCKGFMNLASLQRYLDDNAAAFAPIDVAIHFRIGTHGGNTSGNTHPFVVGRADPHNEDCIQGTGKPVLMHNGVLPVHPRRDDISDTAELALRAGSMKNPMRYLRSISELLRGNRVVVFTPTGVEFFGDEFKKGDDGLMYSNLNHEGSPWWQADLFDTSKWLPAGKTWSPKASTVSPPAKTKPEPEPVISTGYVPPKFLGAITPHEEMLAEEAEDIVAQEMGCDPPTIMSERDLLVFRLSYNREIWSTYEMLKQEEEENEALAAMGC